MMDAFKKSESEEQTNFLIYFRAYFAKAKHIDPRLMFHVPNGGARRLTEARRMKAQGVTPGVPDLFFAVPRGRKAGLFIEMKTKVGGKVSADQAEMIAALRAIGYDAKVAHGADEAREILNEYWRRGEPIERGEDA